MMVSMILKGLLLIPCLLHPTQDAQPSPEELVRRLGSRVFAERENAAKALEALGRPALEALQAASEAEDPEVRARAAALISSIQQRLLIEPTLINLDFEDRPVLDIVRSISEQSGIRITLLPENQPIWQGMRLTLKHPDPLPFWKALDALTEASRTQVQPAGSPNFASTGGLAPSLRLLQGQAALSPTSDSGPFRTTLVSLHHHKDLTFQRSPNAQPTGSGPPGSRSLASQVNDQFYFTLQIQAEPRLLVSQTEPLRILEAVDDRGRSLVPTDASGGALRGNPYFGMGTPMSSIQLQANLLAPGEGKSKLRRLRGIVPVSVATLKPDYLAIKLTEAAGKTFKTEGASLTIDALKLAEADQPKTIDLTIKSNQPIEGDQEAFQLVGPRSHLALQVRFELFNAEGNPVRFLIGRSQTTDGQTVQLSLTIPPIQNNGTPVELRYRDLVTTTTDVEFDFTDVPLP